MGGVSPTAFLRDHPRLLVLTGAGISAASGIPTYRDHSGAWQGANPMQHGDFLASEAHRRRYWARSAVGWRRIAEAKPNASHRALAELESHGLISRVVTQNVDGLHRRAGQRHLIELHGSLEWVVCIDCCEKTSRESYQQELIAGCTELARLPAEVQPDGDAVIPDSLASKLVPPGCSRCGGVMKPDVVFFGGVVPTHTVNQVVSALSDAPALLAIGTSLTVYSGYRFIRWMRQAGKPVAAINIGNTRADDELDFHWREDAAPLLEEMASAFSD